jgi:hypothetical protein
MIELPLTDIMLVIAAGISIVVSILLTMLNIINSRKTNLYSEQVECSTVSVQSNWLLNTPYTININKDTELILKVYTTDKWITWLYKITWLFVCQWEDNWQFYCMWQEYLIYDSKKENWIFSTKFNCLEYAQIKHKLKINITKTPFGTQRTFYFF